MIPNSNIDINLEVIEDVETTKTYRIYNNKIQGYLDELEALRQAIYKVLNTEKYEYPIYSFSYGSELESLIGKDPTYVKIELKRRIEESLLNDLRIESIDNFEININSDELTCTFNVKSVYGNLSLTKEVNI